MNEVEVTSFMRLKKFLCFWFSSFFVSAIGVKNLSGPYCFWYVW